MDSRFTEYADLIIRVGVNLRPGQTLVLSCPVECADIAHVLTEKAYDAGAREVVLRWNDEVITRMKYLRAEDSVFDEFPKWLETLFYEYADRGAALLTIYAEDPELLRGVDPGRIQRWGRASGQKLKAYQERQMANEFQWNVVSVPTKKWARSVFPSVSEAEAVEKLWDAIYHALDLRESGTVDAWREKIKLLGSRAQKLTDYNFQKLIYQNSLGTELTIELPENHKWVGVGEQAKNGAVFAANLPSEEVFTVPKRIGVNGAAVSSKPLALNGTLVRDIRMRFEGGKIVDAFASEGLETLLKSLDLDEGSRYLGEVALVPYHSPISLMNLVFNNTLFDENASCHLAYGSAYPCFKDEPSREEMLARGMNDSMNHIDFMVGTEDLSITGVTQDGRTVPVFANGDFAF
ncbi:MAG: aminopeptidase [Firmicutes bacterium]|nr:aminopeptidase [Bacillota bacterium]